MVLKSIRKYYVTKNVNYPFTVTINPVKGAGKIILTTTQRVKVVYGLIYFFLLSKLTKLKKKSKVILVN